MDFYQLKALDLEGKTVSFDAFRGRKVLLVNTATGCGLAPQLKDLQNLQNPLQIQLKKYHAATLLQKTTEGLVELYHYLKRAKIEKLRNQTGKKRGLFHKII